MCFTHMVLSLTICLATVFLDIEFSLNYSVKNANFLIMNKYIRNIYSFGENWCENTKLKYCMDLMMLGETPIWSYIKCSTVIAVCIQTA